MILVLNDGPGFDHLVTLQNPKIIKLRLEGKEKIHMLINIHFLNKVIFFYNNSCFSLLTSHYGNSSYTLFWVGQWIFTTNKFLFFPIFWTTLGTPELLLTAIHPRNGFEWYALLKPILSRGTLAYKMIECRGLIEK